MPNITGTGNVSLKQTDAKTVVEALQSGFISLVDDVTTANCLTTMLGVDIPVKSISIAPKIGEDTIVLVNIIGDLPAGSKTFPVNASIQFSVIESSKKMFDLQAGKVKLANWLLR